MPHLTFELETISPLFLNGANPKGVPELRAASVRGQLRYWLRAIEGAKTSELAKVWEREADVFGSTERGSSVSVRFVAKGNHAEPEEFFMLPHRSTRRDQSPAYAIPPKQRCTLYLVSRPGLNVPQLASRAAQVWFLLGGLGKRSRRMFGAFNALIKGEQPATADQLVKLTEIKLHSFLPDPSKVANTYPPGQLPEFPTLHPAHSRVMVGSRGYDEVEELMTELFQRLLRTQRYRDNRVFGSAMGGRRASPLIAQVRKVKDSYYPILTVMRSQRRGERLLDWHLYDDFFSEAEQLFEGKTVWGGRFA